MSAIDHEIASQPDLWPRARALAADVADVLPAKGERALVIGCGTSLYMAQAFAVSRESAGHGETDAYPASELPSGRRYDRVIALSRSGTTTEVVRALRWIGDAAPTTAVTAVPDSPVASVAGSVVAMPFADERSVVQTRFATSALVLLRAHLGIDCTESTRQAERALTSELPIDPSRFERFAFLGHAWTIGLANEAALKIREAARAWSEAYPAMEYRHGPIAVADERAAVWPIGEIGRDLITDIERTKATVVRTPYDPLASLVLAQRTAVALANSRNLDPDSPHNLTRSVVLS
jgi:fructoselysine-6-P-deglycase FrlB-like protein